MRWQVQEAKQRFSELVRAATSDGVQFVTRHGEEVVAVVDIERYRELTEGADDFKELLRSAPDDALEIARTSERAPVVQLTGEA